MRIATTTLLLLGLLRCNAQPTLQVKQEVEKKIKAFFMEDKGIFERVADSGKLYTFFFQIDVSRENSRKLPVTSIEANDTIAYRLYPDYQFLKSLRWDIYMPTRKKASFIIPVILEVISSKAETYEYRKSNGLKSFLSLFKDDKNIEDYIYFKPIVFLISKQVFD